MGEISSPLAGARETLKLFRGSISNCLLWGLSYSVLSELFASGSEAGRALFTLLSFAAFSLLWSERFGVRRPEYGVRSAVKGGMIDCLFLFILLFFTLVGSYLLAAIPLVMVLGTGEVVSAVVFLVALAACCLVLARTWPTLVIVHIYAGSERRVGYGWDAPGLETGWGLTRGRDAAVRATLPALLYLTLLCAQLALTASTWMGSALSIVAFPLLTGLIYERALALSRAREKPATSISRSQPGSVKEALARLRASDSPLLEASLTAVSGSRLPADDIILIVRDHVVDALGVDESYAMLVAEHFIAALQPFSSRVVESLPFELGLRVKERTWAFVTEHRPARKRYLVSLADQIEAVASFNVLNEPSLVVEAAACHHPRFGEDPYLARFEIVSVFENASKSGFFLFPLENADCRIGIPEIAKPYDELLTIGDRYWRSPVYQDIIDSGDPPFDALVAFTSLVYAGEHALLRGDDRGVPWEEAARRLGSRLVEPALAYFAHSSRLDSRWASQGGLPTPWSLVKVAAGWEPRARMRFFEVAFRTGWIDCLRVLPHEPWMNELLSRYAESPFGPPARPRESESFEEETGSVIAP